MGSRIPRLVRGAIAATLSLFAAALGHVVAGGGFPGFIGVVLALFLALPACVWLAGRRVSWWRLGLGVTFTQFLFHLFFTIRAGGQALAVATLPGHGSHTVVTDIAVTPGVHAHQLGAAGPAMWLGHAVAAVVTVVFLYWGERVVWELCVEAWGWVFPPRQGLVVVRIRRPVASSAVDFVTRAVRRDWSLTVSPRRGPPMPVAE